MNNQLKLIVSGFFFLLLPFMLQAQPSQPGKVSIPSGHEQTPYRQYAEEGIILNFFEIDNIDFRLYLLYNLSNDDRFSINAEDEYGLFIVNPTEDFMENGFFDSFESFYNETSINFRLIEKKDIFDLESQWKASVTPRYFASITMDIALNRAITDNDFCVNSDPFCTSDIIQFEASHSTQQAEAGIPDIGCIGNSYNPSWYHMRINTGGQFIIHMEGVDPIDPSIERDIDFIIWGPFDDPVTPCVQELTSNKIIDCCYSSSYTENIFLGYPESEHYHNTSHGSIIEHTPEVGEYYILLITNYSRDPCIITFTKTEGSGPGTTDCGILPGIATNSGPYCVGDTIQLSITTQAGATYSWTGPDNFTSNEQNPTIPNCTFEMGGIYTCVTTVDGQTTTGSTEVIVYAQPIADFSFNNVCEGSATQLNSTADTDPSGQEITGYHWDFGDGETADEPNVTHTYASPGDYQVTHIVHTGNGHCIDEITKTVSVYAIPQLTISASPSSVIYGGTATLTVNAVPAGNYSYHWEPANMVTNPNSQTTQTVPLTTSQVFTVTVTNELGGCSNTIQVTVNMAGSDLTATATADQYEICENSSTTLHALPMAGTGNYTYIWSPANLLNNATIQNPVATPPLGTTTFTCIVSDGMTDLEVSVTILVHPKEESSLYESICENESYNFFGQNLNVAGVYNHTLQTIHGCDSVIYLHLSVNPLNEYEFTVSDEENCDEYYWDPEGHEIVYTDHESLVYNQSGSYHRTYKNQLGCDSLVTMNVHFEYTPVPTEIYPMDPDNTTPHWVITATEFQINSYDFHLWDTNPYCHWDTVTWNFAEPIDWLLEPFGDRSSCCKVYVMDQVDDTVWLEAHAFNRCAPQGIIQRYWFVCSFYGIEEDVASTNSATFDVIPNPNNGQMQLLFDRISGKVDVKVYDMKGTLIDSFETYNGNTLFNYDMKTTRSGIYFFVVTCKEGTLAKKVVIER